MKYSISIKTYLKSNTQEITIVNDQSPMKNVSSSDIYEVLVFDNELERNKKYNKIKISNILRNVHIIFDRYIGMLRYTSLAMGTTDPNFKIVQSAFLNIQKFLIDNFTKADEYTYELKNFTLDDETKMSFKWSGTDYNFDFGGVVTEITKMVKDHEQLFLEPKFSIIGVPLDPAARTIIYGDDYMVEDTPE